MTHWSMSCCGTRCVRCSPAEPSYGYSWWIWASEQTQGLSINFANTTLQKTFTVLSSRVDGIYITEKASPRISVSRVHPLLPSHSDPTVPQWTTAKANAFFAQTGELRLGSMVQVGGAKSFFDWNSSSQPSGSNQLDAIPERPATTRSYLGYWNIELSFWKKNTYSMMLWSYVMMFAMCSGVKECECA